MYGTVQHEAWMHRPHEIRQQLAMIRQEKAVRKHGGETPGLLGDLGWELARVAGLTSKRLRQSPGTHARARPPTAEGNQR